MEKQWLDAAMLLGSDSTATVVCPVCKKANLVVLDMPMKDRLQVERYIKCPACKSQSVVQMAEEQSSKTAEGEIANVFALPTRGWTLVIKEGFSGAIRKNGIIQGRRGAARYTGPEFLDSGIPGDASVAVVVDPQFKGLFMVGEKVTFYGRN